jgi:hypothetical protein
MLNNDIITVMVRYNNQSVTYIFPVCYLLLYNYIKPMNTKKNVSNKEN